MIRHLTYLLHSVLVAAWVVGCSNSGIPDNHSLNSHAPTIAGIPVKDDPCAMVLVPLASSGVEPEDGVDRSIARYQKAVTQSLRPIYQLERLGWAFVAKARESRDAGYYRLAEQTAACIDTKVADAPESLLLRGHVLHNLHRFSEAEALARRVVDQRGLWFDFALLGDVLAERGALNEAIDAYQRVIDQRPGPQAYARIAQLRWFKGDLDGALEMMATAVRTTSPRTPEPAAWAHVQLARLLMQADELSVADTVLDRALALQREYPPALHMKGRLRLAQDNFFDAIPLLKSAVQADPLPEFRWTLYEALHAAGQDQAADDQKAALQRYGESEDRRTLALFLATQGDAPETALRMAMHELQQRADVFTLDAVAWALSGAGKNSEALDYSRRALAEGTQDARLLLHAGVIAARAGDSVQALERLINARALQQTLLPSERQQLANQLAALEPRIPTLAEAEPPSQEHLAFFSNRR